PLLVPRCLVHPVVVAATGRDRDLVELRMEEQGGGGVLTARGSAVDAHPADVVIGVFLRYRLVPEDAVGKAGVLEVVPADIVERLRAIGRPHAIYLHDDESQIGERGKATGGAEGLRDVGAVRAGVDLLDDRILLFWVELARPADDAPDVGLAVAALGREHLR